MAVYLKDLFTDSFSPSTYLQDNFAGTNGTVLTSHTMDVGSGWTSQSNNFKLNGSGAAGPINGSDCYNTADAGHNDMEITANVAMDSSGDNIGVTGWYVSNIFNWWLTLDRFGGLSPGRFGLYDGSNWKDYLAFSITNDQSYALKLRLIGKTLVGYLNGSPLVGFVDGTTNQSSLAGIRTAVDSHTLANTFLVVKPCSSTLLTAHTMNIGPGWTAGSGNFILDGLGNALPDNVGGALLVSDASHADATGSLDLTPISQTVSCISGLVARYQDTNNYFVYQMNQTTGKAELVRVQGGTPTTIANPSQTFTQGTKYTLKLVTSGNNFTGYVNGSQVLTATDSFQATKTVWGVGYGASTGLTQFANFSVTDGSVNKGGAAHGGSAHSHPPQGVGRRRQTQVAGACSYLDTGEVT